MQTSIICSTCGTHLPSSYTTTLCPICNDDRQYIPEGGQSWTKPETLRRNHSVRIKALSDNLYELDIKPGFGIGQRALLVLSEHGNVLWDCIPLLDEGAIAFIRSKGGLKAIAFSHPHYYSNMNEWAELFDCPIYIHQSDEQWIFNKGPRVQLWKGEEQPLWDGIRIINIGGHFPGSSILHVPSLSPQGTVLCGDTFILSPSKQHMAVLYSYPNRIPLPVAEVKRISQRMAAIPFDSLYSYLSGLDIQENTKQVWETSVQRYLS